jgi:hypothetical protein
MYKVTKTFLGLSETLGELGRITLITKIAEVLPNTKSNKL